jgi:hypothetical protein
VILNDDLVVLTKDEFDALPEYSCSTPTGTTIGRLWKRKKDYDDETKGWKMGEYTPHYKPKTVGIRWRHIVIEETA